MDDVPGQNVFQMASTKDQHAVETLATNCADETLGEGIGSGRPDRCLDDPDVLRSEDLIETRAVQVALRPSSGLL
jgi:hypothetical protein